MLAPLVSSEVGVVLTRLRESNTEYQSRLKPILFVTLSMIFQEQIYRSGDGAVLTSSNRFSIAR